MRKTIKLLPLLLLVAAVTACGASERRTSSGSSGVVRAEPYVPSTGKPTTDNRAE